MTIRRFVTQSEFDWLEKKKEEEKKRREEEAENAKKGGKKDNKKAPKQENKVEEERPKPQPGEEANIPVEEVIAEPTNAPVEKTEKPLSLKATAICDYCNYEVSEKAIDFYPTMMYTSRVHKVSVKNTSTIKLHYNNKIVSADTGKI